MPLCPKWKGVVGLSPRVRGNRLPLFIDADGAGSIPACAGEPTPPCSLIKTGRVYPRVCGGTPIGQVVTRPDLGLSPRVRGNRRFLGRRLCLLGSIPACAGEPLMYTVPTAAFSVYPRVCGGTHACFAS